MSIMLGDFINEDNIKLSNEEIKSALKEYYSDAITTNFNEIRDSFYKFSGLSEGFSSKVYEYEIKGKSIKKKMYDQKKDDKSYKNTEEIIKTYSSMNKQVA